MNIFAVSSDPEKCARALDDSRLGKMILETAQVLCTVVNLEAGSQVAPYKNAHVHHPAVIWARGKKRNWSWLWRLGIAYGMEYIHRFGKKHASSLVIEGLSFKWADRVKRRSTPRSFYNGARHKGLGIDYTGIETHMAYKQYLIDRWQLQGNVKWTNRKPPKWSPYTR
jgi:hypothetical protein